MGTSRTLRTLCIAGALGLPGLAFAQSEAAIRANLDSPLAPKDGMLELGIFGGIYLPPADHELFDDSKVMQRPLRSVAPDFGARLAVFPIAWLGAEAEAAFVPTALKTGENVNVIRGGGHLILQLPGQFTPFVLAGAAGLFGSSADTVLGGNADPAFHFGFGLKGYINRWVALRAEARNSVTSANEEVAGQSGKVTNHFEVIAGLTFGFNRPDAIPPDLDGDRDGFKDSVDKCPTVAGVAPDGCPPPDTDGDGKDDLVDKCIFVPSPEPDGCPPPDTDKDGILDRDDKCIDVPGVPPNGCPDLDPDKDGFDASRDMCPDMPGPVNGCPDGDADGIADKDDKCPQEPETKNGYQDTDGCPDELPKAIKKYVGTIAGITFALDSAMIKPSSFATLNGAVKVMKDYPELRIEISGHTDNTGTDEHNDKLSDGRAASVKAYLVEKGIEESRIVSKGYGSKKPVADNKNEKGRSANRRIEFMLLTPDAPAPSSPLAPPPAGDLK